MESLPALPLHQLELKTPLDAPQFSKLAECLQTGDVKHDEAVNKASEDLANLRKEVINPSMDIQGIEKLHKYFGQLHLISLRVEMDQKGQPAFVKFKWNDTNYFGKISGSINVEKFFLLFNIAAVHSHLANEALKNGTDEDLKKSCKHLQCASGVFMWIKQNMADVNKVDKTIVQDETVDFHYQVLLVHAQEQLLYKAIKDKRKNNLLAKLCQHVFESYQIMFDDIQQEDIGDFGLKKHPDWYEFTYCRMSFYACLTWLLNGLNYDEQSQYGNALYCYEKAVVFADGFPRSSKSKVTETSTATDFLKNLAKQKADTSKRDNSFIFHEKVPESLPDVVGQCLVKPISFTAYDAKIVGPDLFPTTISIEAVSATSVYSEKKDNLLRELTSEIESSNEELTQFETSLGLGSLKYMDAIPIENKPLPQELVERVAKLSLKPKTAEEIDNELQTLSKTVFGIDEKLSQISEKLDSEGRKNAQLQSEWGITRDVSKFDQIATQYEEYRNEHHLSSDKFKQLKDVIGLHVENLRLMSSMSIPELKIQLIAPDDDALDDQSFDLADQLKPMEKMKRLIDKVKEMKTQREKFLEQLKSELDADDITVQLSATKDSNHEAIFEEELKKHEKTVGLMRQNLSAQSNICSAVEEAYAEYAVAKRKLDEMHQRREDRVEELVLSFDSCFQLRQKLEEFLDFYSDLSGKVSSLREKLLDLSQLEEEARERIITARKNKPERPTAKKPNLIPSSPTIARPDAAVVKPVASNESDLSSMLDPEFLKTLTPEERQLIETLSQEELRQLQMGVAPSSGTSASAPPQPMSPAHNAGPPANVVQNVSNASIASSQNPAIMTYSIGMPDNFAPGGVQGNAMLDALSEDEKRLLFGGSCIPVTSTVSTESMPARRTSVNRSTNRRRDTAPQPAITVMPNPMPGPASIPSPVPIRPGVSGASTPPTSQIVPGAISAFGQTITPYQQQPTGANMASFQNPASMQQGSVVTYPQSVATSVQQPYAPTQNPTSVNQGIAPYGQMVQNQRSHSVPTAIVAPNVASSQGISQAPTTIPQNVSSHQVAPASSHFIYQQAGYQQQYYQAHNMTAQPVRANQTTPHQVSNPYSSTSQVHFQPQQTISPANQYIQPVAPMQNGSPYSSMNSAASPQHVSMTQNQVHLSNANMTTNNQEHLAQIEYMKQQQTALLQQLEVQNKRQIELERQLNEQKLQHEQNVKRIESENQEKMLKEQQKLIQEQIEKQQKALEKQLEDQKAQQQLFMNQIMMNYSYMQQQYQQNQQVKSDGSNINAAGFNDATHNQTLSQNHLGSQNQTTSIQSQATNVLPVNQNPYSAAENQSLQNYQQTLASSGKFGSVVPQSGSEMSAQNQMQNASNHLNQAYQTPVHTNLMVQNESNNYASYQTVQIPASQLGGYQHGPTSNAQNPNLTTLPNSGPDINMSEYFATYDPKKPVDHKVLAAMMKQQQESLRQKQLQEQQRQSQVATQKEQQNQKIGQSRPSVQNEQQPQNQQPSQGIYRQSAQNTSQVQSSGSRNNVAATTSNSVHGSAQQSNYQNAGISQTHAQKSSHQMQSLAKTGTTQPTANDPFATQTRALQVEPLKPTSGSNLSVLAASKALPKLDSKTAKDSSSLDMSDIDRQLEQMNADVSREQTSKESGTSLNREGFLPNTTVNSSNSSLREVLTEKEGTAVNAISAHSAPNMKKSDAQNNVDEMNETSNHQNFAQISNAELLLGKSLPTSNVQRVQPIARTSELYKDGNSLSKLKSDLDKLEKHVVNMHKQTLNGPTILQREWSDLESRFSQTSQSSCDLSLSSCEVGLLEDSNRTSKCYSHNTLLRGEDGDSRIVIINIDSCSELLPRFIVFGAVETEPHMKTFWNSVEEFGVTLVVSFQSRSERCPYIPDTQGVNVEIGEDFYVRLQNTSVSQYWLQRTLNLFSPSTSSNRTVTHLQFLEWPKMSSAEVGEKYPKHGPLISFARTVRHFYNLQDGFDSPVVLQSNYDVVQSGMLMLLMQAMQSLDHGIGMLDIPTAVNDIRRLFHQAIISSPNELYYLYLCYLHYVYQFMSSRGFQSGYQVINSPTANGLPKLQPVAKTPVDASNENASRESANETQSTTRGTDGSPLRDLRQLMSAESFSIGTQSGSPKPKHNFDDNQLHIGQNSDPSDPFSSLDAMWKMK